MHRLDLRPWAFAGIFSGGNIFGGESEIHGTGTNEGAENKNRTAKSVNILMFSVLFKVNLIVS